MTGAHVALRGEEDGHLDPEVVGDLDEGLLAPADAARARAHIDGCARCSDLERGLRDVRALLAGLPDPGPLPQDVIDRVSSALAAATAGPGRDPAADPAPPSPAATPAPGALSPDVTSLPERRARRERRRRGLRALGAAAAVAAAALVAVPAVDGLRGLGGASDEDSAAGGAAPADEGAAAGGRTAVLASGRDYRGTDLGGAARELTADARPAQGAQDPAPGPPAAADQEAAPDQRAAPGEGSAPGGPGPTGSAFAAPDEDGSSRSGVQRLRGQAALDACVAALAGARPPVTGAPVALDLGRWGAGPAAVLVAPTDDPAAWAVHVVGPSCGLGTGDVLASALVAR